MTTINYGKDFKYASTRLKGTYVVYLNELVYVGEVKNNGIVIIKGMSGAYEEVPIDNLNFGNIKLGYVNYGKKCFYTYRNPSRYYKQGLTSQVFCNPGLFAPHKKYFQDMIKGKYKKPELYAEELLCGEAESRAFSRNFSLLKKGEEGLHLRFRDTTVGFCKISPQGSKLTYHLNNKFDFLHEMLEKSYNV